MKTVTILLRAAVTNLHSVQVTRQYQDSGGGESGCRTREGGVREAAPIC